MHGPNDGLSNVKVDGSGMRFGILCATFNFDIVDALRIGAVQGFTNHGVAAKDIHTIWVPGAFELPVAALALAKSGKVDAVVALGAVIRGDTPHFEYVSGGAYTLPLASSPSTPCNKHSTGAAQKAIKAKRQQLGQL